MWRTGESCVGGWWGKLVSDLYHVAFKLDPNLGISRIYRAHSSGYEGVGWCRGGNRNWGGIPLSGNKNSVDFSWHRAYYPTHFMGHPKGAHVGDDTAEHATKAHGTGCTYCTACSPRKLCNRQFAPLSAPITNCQPAQNNQPAQPIASRPTQRRYTARLRIARRLKSPHTSLP